MVFALPLPLGEESVCEYLDIKLTAPMDGEALLAAVDAQLTGEMQFTEVYPPEMSFQEITAARYRMEFHGMKFHEIDAATLENALRGPLLVTKKSKKGMIEVDLQPNLLSFTITEGEDSAVLVDALLSASEKSFVNPENLVKALRTVTGAVLDDYDILRQEIYAGERVFK